MLLVGGFVMLRFINPALLTPDFYNMVNTLSLGDRRNLTLLCKLIQNISNQSLCNEEWMLDCNPFIEKNMNRLEDFYVHVLMDPNQETGKFKFLTSFAFCDTGITNYLVVKSFFG